MGQTPPKMFVTTDAVSFEFQEGRGLRVLLIERLNEPYKGTWCLPGGFVELDEDLPDACARELEEETGLSPAAMAQVGAWGTPGRDPRGRNVSVAYLAVVRPGDGDGVCADTDAADVAWHPADELPAMGFDHAQMVAAARERLGVLARRTALVFALLPERFGLDALRAVLTAVDGRAASEADVRALARRAPVERRGEGLYRCTAADWLAPLEPA